MKTNNRKLTSPRSLNSYIKSICDVMRRSGRAGHSSMCLSLHGCFSSVSLTRKRKEKLSMQRLWVWSSLLHWNIPTDGGIGHRHLEHVDETHMFTLSQIYEGLLLKMGEKNNDGGQFFTPREVIRVMVKVIDPKIGETVYDPCCGTGGFLAQAYTQMKEKANTADDIETLKTRTFYGREKENLVYPIAIANLVLHEIDEPHIWYGNTLTGLEVYGGLFQGAPGLFDVILTNPPFGGKEGKDAQTRFAYKTSSTQVLFLQHVIDSLKPGGRCGIVMDEGVLFRTNETAFIQTKWTRSIP